MELEEEVNLPSRRPLDEAEAAFFAELQKLLPKKQIQLPKKISLICGVDAAYSGDRVVAVASLFEEGRLVETSSYSGTCSFPYQSGLFYLREGPFVTQAVKGLMVRPQLACFDAHGAAHPRFAGLASICGFVLAIPSVGIAKSLLVGKVEKKIGGFERIVYKGRTVGFVTRVNGSRRYWSPGHAVSIRHLAFVADRYSQVCLSALSESDRKSKDEISVRNFRFE